MKAILVVAAWLSLVVPSSPHAQNALPYEPLRTWENLLTSLQPLRTIHVRERERLRSRLDPSQYVPERVYVLLERVVGVCPDIRFNPFAYMDAVSVALQGYFPGVTVSNSDHGQNAEMKAFAESIEPVMETFGAPACEWFYKRPGPGGALVQKFRDFTGAVPGAYRHQVLWTDAEICRRPSEFWAPLRPHPGDIAEACRNADRRERLLKR